MAPVTIYARFIKKLTAMGYILCFICDVVSIKYTLFVSRPEWILTKLSPYMDLENHRCDHKVYIIEAIFINLLKLDYKNTKATFQSRTSTLLYIFT